MGCRLPWLSATDLGIRGRPRLPKWACKLTTPLPTELGIRERPRLPKWAGKSTIKHPCGQSGAPPTAQMGG